MAVGTKGSRQYQGLFETIPFKATVDLASAADAATVAANIAVAGAEVGDFVRVAIGVDAQDLTVDAQVTAADTVTVTVNNNTGGAVNLASTTITGIVEKPNKSVWDSL